MPWFIDDVFGVRPADIRLDGEMDEVGDVFIIILRVDSIIAIAWDVLVRG